MVERGGFVANLPFARPAHYTSAGGVLPVHLHPDHPPIPPAPGPGDPRAFDWRRHGGWDQFLIRDTDPGAPHAYFAGIAAAKVELVARRGRWRLYARVQ
jgi:hypothetical protein